MDESVKHRAVLSISLEVHPIIEKTGECSGHPISLAKLKEYGIKSQSLKKVDGNNLHECLMNLKEKLEGLK